MNESNILKNFGVPVAYEEAHFVASIDEVLIEMYEQAYERMCLEDHAKTSGDNARWKDRWTLTRQQSASPQIS